MPYWLYIFVHLCFSLAVSTLITSSCILSRSVPFELTPSETDVYLLEAANKLSGLAECGGERAQQLFVSEGLIPSLLSFRSTRIFTSCNVSPTSGRTVIAVE